ncbi:MAG: hypothetical protein LBD81_02720 [Holosporaceae bacterium]|jgi:hypothetical protein|nr:hypothetical protein [Holosporaceae bacterium]
MNNIGKTFRVSFNCVLCVAAVCVLSSDLHSMQDWKESVGAFNTRKLSKEDRITVFKSLKTHCQNGKTFAAPDKTNANIEDLCKTIVFGRKLLKVLFGFFVSDAPGSELSRALKQQNGIYGFSAPLTGTAADEFEKANEVAANGWHEAMALVGKVITTTYSEDYEDGRKITCSITPQLPDYYVKRVTQEMYDLVNKTCTTIEECADRWLEKEAAN